MNDKPYYGNDTLRGLRPFALWEQSPSRFLVLDSQNRHYDELCQLPTETMEQFRDRLERWLNVLNKTTEEAQQ